jgi:hypothetical protein
MDTKYKNKVLESIMRQSSILPYQISKLANIIFAGTTPGSPARSLVVDMIADSAHKSEDWNRMVERLNREVINDAMKTMMEDEYGQVLGEGRGHLRDFRTEICCSVLARLREEDIVYGHGSRLHDT